VVHDAHGTHVFYKVLLSKWVAKATR